MAGPAIVTVNTTWTKVADSVQIGHIWIKDSGPKAYFHTWVEAGDPGPDDMEFAIKMDSDHIPIASDRDIDVYMICQGSAGVVRVDI